MTLATIPELLAAATERFRDRPAIVTADWSESFADLANAVGRSADSLRRRGLHITDRVLIAAPNSPSLVHAWLGVIWAGGIPAAVNPDLTRPEIEYLVDDLQPRIVLRHEDLDVIDVATADPAVRSLAAQPLNPAAIVYTSGTTSRPKGVLVRHAAYTETGRSFPGWIGLRGEQRLWACLPLFHINAQAYALMTALAHGFTLALTPKFHASTFWQEARQLEVTSVNVVGAMLEMVAAQPPGSWVESRLRTIYAAPGPAPQQREQLEQRFRVRIVTGYGMSENPFGCVESRTSRTKAHSIGSPRQPASGAFENELRILREDGADVPGGEVGELCFRNPVLTPGYWNAPEITDAALRGGWLHTGDAGYRDEDGDVFLTGRYKEMIRRRGENIAPGEVEEALCANPAVQAAAVFGVPAGLMEEEVVAVVVLRNGGSLDEPTLKTWAATRLAAYKVPGTIIFRDSLPMTPTHRVARDQLRREYGHPDD
ncbi:MAG: ATP-dependent acyl-CoA ligase [Chloroflexi bacterium]|nr:MAG: ATP-dependent acyl-CoA ligase [Chloroflexota bacterium]